MLVITGNIADTTITDGCHRPSSTTQESCVQCAWLLTMPTVMPQLQCGLHNHQRQLSATPPGYSAMWTVVVFSIGGCPQQLGSVSYIQQLSTMPVFVGSVSGAPQHHCHWLRVIKRVCVFILCSGCRLWAMCPFVFFCSCYFLVLFFFAA